MAEESIQAYHNSQCYTLPMHVVQSPEWGKFKSEMGTPAIRAGEIQYTKHKIPFSSYFYAYCPKVDPTKIDFSSIENSLKENGCIAINFDVPDVIVDTPEAESATKIFTTEKRCKKSPRSTFARSNILLDLTLSEEKLLENMHKKHRYNIGYAQRSGVVVYEAKAPEDFEIFYNLLSQTAQRQKYYIHSKTYYQRIWEILGEQNMCKILIAKHNETPLVAWMLFVYENVLYYPFGGSSEEKKNLQGSNLIAWEAIRLGKSLGCKVFDMWGAADDPEDEKDDWYGFTHFKLKFGGKYVKYIDSYDFVLNDSVYTLFNTANDLRWRLLNLIK